MLSGRHSVWANLRFKATASAIFCPLALFLVIEREDVTARLRPSPTQGSRLPSISKNIWHIFLHKQEIKPSLRPAIHSWAELNLDHDYHLVETVQATDILFDLYRDRPDIVHTFQKLESTVMRADFLRYVLLARHGGVYTDVDTQALRPINEWIPPEYNDSTRVVTGVEYDQLDDTERDVAMPHCSRSASGLSSRPRTIHCSADFYKTDVEHLRPTDKEVITTTGPALWTASVIKYLRGRGYHNVSYSDFSRLREPKLMDDVLILPIDAFGVGQPHSNSSESAEGAPDALAQHLFSMSWRHGCTPGDVEPCFQ
ncbi:hypothetical protein LTR70_000993 [Exophiala xenobiotica]|uniref:Initiation-specific alpha-1,6-mannosyltransferase n=1 Tax=Lithohypha guttulata TaxID=1690604 RepID=A0ABR0K0J4_9EURO|nr:hypothetical protein LTR24_008248 [Lithohypha guttulata]KAK5329156.1 hypothetical protein LTR70_000993 [Exophiala xenobiotica]